MLKYQSEVDQQIKEEEKLMIKEKKKRYKEELDQQNLEKTRSSPLKSPGAKSLDKNMKVSITVNEGEAFIREAKEREKIAKLLLLQKIKENEEQTKAQQANKLNEKDALIKLTREQDELDKKGEMLIKARKLQLAEGLRSSYEEHLLGKKRAIEEERRNDRLVLDSVLAKPEHNELEILKVIL